MRINLLFKCFAIAAALIVSGTAFSQEARIGTTEYATLQEAIDAASGEEEVVVTLLKDVTATSNLTIDGKYLVLDMEEHSITTAGDASVGLDIANSTVEINNGTINASAVNNSYGISAYNCHVTINEVTINTAKPSSSCIYTYNIDGNTPQKNKQSKVDVINSNLTSACYGINVNGTDNTLFISGNTITANRGINIRNGSGYGDNDVYVGETTINAACDDVNGTAVGIYNEQDNFIELCDSRLNITDGQGIVSHAGIIYVFGETAINVSGSKTSLAHDGTTVMQPSAIVFDATGDNTSLQDNPNAWIYVESGTYTTADGIPAAVSLADDGNDRQYIFIKEGGCTFSTDVSAYYGIDPQLKGTVTIGSTTYDTLAEAVAAVQDGETITLGGPMQLTESVVIDNGKTFTLDFNDYPVLSSKGNYAIEVRGGSDVSFINGGLLSEYNSAILVKDATLGLTNMEVYGQGGMAVAAGGNANITINDGTYYSQEFTVLWDGTNNNITIKGGMFMANDNAVLGGNGSKGNGGSNITIEGGAFGSNIQTEGYIACGIYSPANDNIHVKGGMFNADPGVGILARAGSITIEDGVTINTYDKSEGGWVGDSKNVVPCAAIVYDAKAQYPGLTDGATITVNGGTFTTGTSVNDIVVLTADGQDSTDYVTVNGGTFSDNSAVGYLAEGKKLTEKKDEYDNTYYIVETDNGIPVVEITTDGTDKTMTFKVVDEPTITYATYPADGFYRLNEGSSAPDWDGDNGEISMYVKKAVFDKSFAGARPTSTASWFNGMASLETIDSIEYLNTSKVTDMHSMFSACYALKSLDVSRFSTGKVTDMSFMFNGLWEVDTLDLSHFTTDNVTNMAYMFSTCNRLATINLGSFNTSKVTDMSYMFGGDINLTSLDVSGLNTDNVTDMSGMFSNCQILDSLDVSSLNTANVTNMSEMFMGCISLKSLDITNFDTGKLQDISRMFSTCPIDTLYIGDNDFTGITSKDDAFMNVGSTETPCTLYVGSNFDTSVLGTATDGKYTWLEGTFTIQKMIPVAVLSTDGNGDKTLTFTFDYEASATATYPNDGVYKLNKVGIPAWYGSEVYNKVTKVVFEPSFADARPSTTSSWFRGMSSLTSIEGIEYLNTSEVYDMSSMFCDCQALTSLDVSHFNTENVTDMQSMFNDCRELTSLDVSHFYTGKVTDMGMMFCYCSGLTELDISNFNMSSVTNVWYMFGLCSGLKKLNLGNNDLNDMPDGSYKDGAFYDVGRTTPCVLLVGDGFDKSVLGTATNGKYTWLEGTFTLDTSTGIKGIANGSQESKDTPVYNLRGQRVGKNYRGVIISNGRKVINR